MRAARDARSAHRVGGRARPRRPSERRSIRRARRPSSGARVIIDGASMRGPRTTSPPRCRPAPDASQGENLSRPVGADAGPRRDHRLARHGARVVGVHVRRRGVPHRGPTRRGAHGLVAPRYSARNPASSPAPREPPPWSSPRSSRRTDRVPLRRRRARGRHQGRRRRAAPGKVHPTRAAAVHDRVRQRPRHRHRLRADQLLRGSRRRGAVHASRAHGFGRWR